MYRSVGRACLQEILLNIKWKFVLSIHIKDSKDMKKVRKERGAGKWRKNGSSENFFLMYIIYVRAGEEERGTGIHRAKNG